VTMLQKPHALGGFGLTPNVLAQIPVKVVMTSRFLKLVGSLPPEEQWHVPCLLNLTTGYDILLNNHNCKVQEMHTGQDHPPSPNEFLLLPPLESLHKTHVRNQELPQPGDSRPPCVMPPSQNAISKQMMNNWTLRTLLRRRVHKILTLGP
jgi:hypothetical protein